MNNHQEQFNLVYDQYIDKIYRFVYLKVNSKEAAEDITSKVFLKGFEAFQKGQEIKNMGAFLYQIARNSVTDHYRDRGRTQMISPDHVAEAASSAPNVHETAVFNADMEAVKAAIGGLKKEYQDVLILHYLEDMKTEEIAGILERPVGTVRVMIHRGLQALKGQLSQES